MDSEDDHGYTLDPEPVASGGQGAVYFGYAPDGSPVAVKVAAKGGQAARALMREMELLRHMRDAGVSGVMPILDSFRVGERPAMAMPRYPDHFGNWLKRTLMKPGPDTLADILDKHARIARTLASVHKVYYEGGTVVHRDVKPENLFLDDQGQLFLGDFGGAMAVEELRAVELAMFGTPMWAPLDQLLPGRAMPDPTWDTYATCVLLYAAITRARPAYQADPRELLTPAGQALWEAARTAVEAQGPQRADAQKRFAVMRKGSTAADLVDLTGRAALVAGDREAIANGVERLCTLAAVPDEARIRLTRALWNLLVRGLSPLSHPSPPNRFRDADELAEEIEDLSRILQDDTTPVRANHEALSALMGDTRGAEVDPGEVTTLRAGPPIVGAVASVGLVAVIAIGLWLAWPTLTKAFISTRTLPDRVAVEAGTVETPEGTVAVAAFALDTTEVSVAEYRGCMENGNCPTTGALGKLDRPAAPISFDAARAVCEHLGGRIPTEAQWLHAHGPDRFPWGTDGATCDHAVALGCADELQPVGSGRLGPSRHGAIDLAGNAWEWVTGLDGTPVLLGGGLRSNARELGAAGRRKPAEGVVPPLAGVRCVYGP
jgi:serine/threonine protein kinase